MTVIALPNAQAPVVDEQQCMTPVWYRNLSVLITQLQTQITSAQTTLTLLESIQSKVNGIPSAIFWGLIQGTLTDQEDLVAYAAPLDSPAFVNKVGFNGTAPIAKQTVTGAKGGNVALANLCIALAATGLITDSTT